MLHLPSPWCFNPRDSSKSMKFPTFSSRYVLVAILSTERPWPLAGLSWAIFNRSPRGTILQRPSFSGNATQNWNGRVTKWQICLSLWFHTTIQFPAVLSSVSPHHRLYYYGLIPLSFLPFIPFLYYWLFHWALSSLPSFVLHSFHTVV